MAEDNGHSGGLDEHLLSPLTPERSTTNNTSYSRTPLRYFFARNEENGPTPSPHQDFTPPTVSRTPAQPRTERRRQEHNGTIEDPLMKAALVVNHHPEEDDDSSGASLLQEDLERERHLQLATMGLLGRPYASNSSFWCNKLPASIALGGILGVLTLLLFATIHYGLHLWFPNAITTTANDETKTPLKQGGWKWLIISTSGGLACGLILLLPGAPSVGTVRTMFHDAADLKGSARESPYVLLACVVCLVTGAPLGPEMALGSLGSGLAALLAHLNHATENHRALYVLAGMAGALGGLFSTPLLGVLLVHELYIAGRGAVISSSSNNPTASSREPILYEGFMEHIVLMATSATVSHVVLKTLAPSTSLPHVINLGSDHQTWYLLAALPMGVLCALVGSLMMVCLNLFRSLRVASCRILHEQCYLPRWLVQILFPTAAGVLHGLLAMYNPYLVGSGMPFVRQFLTQDELHPSGWLIWTALTKTISLSLCLGFGLVGGPLLPMVFVGLCVGLALATLFPVLPTALVVPSCICGTLGSFVPIPLTLVLASTMAFQLTPEQMGPPLVATLTAFTLTGGVGLLRRVGEERLGVNPTATGDLDSQDWIGDEAAYWDRQRPSDKSVVRGVQSTIFGHMLD